jgi:hypothetical protein
MPTPGLFHDPIYAAIYKLWRRFRRELIPDISSNLSLAFLSPWRVYELWCYFRVRDVLSILQGCEPDDGFHTWFPLHYGLQYPEITLNEHRWLSWKAKGITLHYQPGIYIYANDSEWISIGLNIRPDILIQCGKKLWVLDSKMKKDEKVPDEPLEEDSFHVSTTWLKLHQYRDSIRWRGNEKIPVVKGGVLLFPRESYNPRFFQAEHILSTGYGGVILYDKANDAIMPTIIERWLHEE